MKRICILLLTIMAALSSCKKFLDKKPDKALAVPSTLQDLQSLLDNTNTMNTDYCCYGEVSADNYYLPTAVWQARAITERNAYIWESDLFNDNERNDWSLPYIIVYYSNVVMDELKKENFISGTQEQKDNLQGQALFFRSFSFYTLLQDFAKPYSADSSATDPGIPLRLVSDFNVRSTRARVKECYEQVINDTKAAAQLLPVVSSLKTRPSKTAAFALLARTYLTMGDYPHALQYADSTLMLQSSLLDYTTLNPAAARPVPVFNAEVIFHSIFLVTNTLNISAKVDSNLYSSYDTNDLRRTVFFSTAADGSHAFKGSYDGSARSFNGFATDELYLIRAECYARAGNIAAAMNDLNTLLSKRWAANAFIPFTATDMNEALQQIVAERRKELLFRGTRWTDLRRLNKEPQFSTTLRRKVNNQDYFLNPNDPRYVLRIPQLVIQETGMEQNPR